MLFDYWCHEASLCHLDDLPLHRWAMRTYLDRLPAGAPAPREWLRGRTPSSPSTSSTLSRRRGPLRASQLEDRSEAAWEWGHWTDEVSSRQTIARMLDRLWRRAGSGSPTGSGSSAAGTCSSAACRTGRWRAADAEPLDEPARSSAAPCCGRSACSASPGPRTSTPTSPAAATPVSAAPAAGVLGELERRGELARRRRRRTARRLVGAARAPRAPRELERRPPHRRPLAVRQPDLRPRPRRGAVRLRPPARDLRAGGEAPLGLLRAADPAPRPASSPAPTSASSATGPHPAARVLALHPEPGRAAPRGGRAGARLTRPLARSRAQPMSFDLPGLA